MLGWGEGATSRAACLRVGCVRHPSPPPHSRHPSPPPARLARRATTAAARSRTLYAPPAPTPTWRAGACPPTAVARCTASRRARRRRPQMSASCLRGSTQVGQAPPWAGGRADMCVCAWVWVRLGGSGRGRTSQMRVALPRALLARWRPSPAAPFSMLPGATPPTPVTRALSTLKLNSPSWS